MYIGKFFDSLLKENECYCMCKMKNGDRCTNKHRYLYKFMDGTILKACGVKSHKKQIYDRFIKNFHAHYNLYNVNYFNKTKDNKYKFYYTVIGIDVDATYHYDNPIVKLDVPVNKQKKIIEKNIDTNDQIIRQSNYDISKLKANIASLEKQIEETKDNLQKRVNENFHLRCAVCFIENNTIYTPSPHHCDTNDKCSICLTEMDTNDSSRLYECTHSFHNDCIQKWFHNKEHLSCPVCRAPCNSNNYFSINTS